ncbi:MAG: hypothetical protein HKN72_17520 [Gemmatimonadetes bacterium]|nr:hypothetical protein [Gemmatimonadota bacterium]
MTDWLKRIRGAVGMGLTWAGLWSAIGALVAVLPGTIIAPYPIPLEWLVGFSAQFAAQFAVLGFIGGTTFSMVLGATEGRRRFDQMSLTRFAAWGAIGGLMMLAVREPIAESVMRVLVSVGMPGVNWAYGISGSIIVLLGAGSAAGSLALARSVDDQELLEAGEGIVEIGLTDHEVRRLL